MGQIKNIKLHIVTDIKMSTSQKSKDLFLIAVDSEPHSLQAFNWYLDHLYNPCHEVGFVHVYTAPDSCEDEGCHQENEAKRRRDALMFTYQQLSDKRGIKSRVFCKEKKGDSIGNIICKLASEHTAKSIVVGQRGLGTVKRIFGSVSEHVLHHAHMPVIIVPCAKGKNSH